MARKGAEQRMWVELSSGQESDWRACFKICKRAFQEDPLYKYTHPDPEKRALFIEKYFDYLYHVVFKDDRGLLSVIKTIENGEEKIIGGAAVTIDWDEEAEKDDSAWRSVDEEGWQRHSEHDKWEMKAYFYKLEKMAEQLGTNLMAGVFQAVDDGYRGKGVGTRFVMKAVQMMSDEVLRRKHVTGEKDPKPPLAYCVCDHPRARNFTKNCGFVEVGQFRNDVPTETGDASYLWLFLLPPQDPTWIDIVRKAFQEKSRL